MKEGKAYIGDEIVEGNILISQFMDCKIQGTLVRRTTKDWDFPFPFGGLMHPIEDLKYHSSWDWLMPVWYKFRLLDAPTGLECELLNLIGRLAQDLAYEEITIFHKNLVLAITWYNQNKQS